MDIARRRTAIIGTKNIENQLSLSLTDGSESRKLLQFHVKQVRAVSSAVRASGLHPEGRVFKSRTAHHLRIIPSGAVVQSVRTPACHAGGREFESRRPRQNTKKAMFFRDAGAESAPFYRGSTFRKTVRRMCSGLRAETLKADAGVRPSEILKRRLYYRKDPCRLIEAPLSHATIDIGVRWKDEMCYPTVQRSLTSDCSRSNGRPHEWHQVYWVGMFIKQRSPWLFMKLTDSDFMRVAFLLAQKEYEEGGSPPSAESSLTMKLATSWARGITRWSRRIILTTMARRPFRGENIAVKRDGAFPSSEQFAGTKGRP
jgi:hypothetical protein